ncbi:hypothetical protein [Nevskia ramosa]|uniref:hypothetical protein n=1 Tax=Nevskia ramosa TaxID=64002 RepID=UPI003D09F59F
MTVVACRACRKPFAARVADINRGWGKFCSKSCKATEQESRTGQHRTHLQRRNAETSGEPEGFSTAQFFSNEADGENTGDVF